MTEVLPKQVIRELLCNLFLIDMVETDDENKEQKQIDEFGKIFSVIETQRCLYRSVISKTTNLIGQLLPSYDEKRFRSTVRMSREQFWRVYESIKDHQVFKTSRQFPVSVQLLSLHRFGVNGNAASHLQLAKDFGIGDGGTLNKFTKRVIVALLSTEQQWIKWPGFQRRTEIANAMGLEKFPYCIGFVDGIHIGIYEAPEDDPISYFNRKGFYSFNVQLVIDPDKNIIAYHVGQPGKVHDSKVFSLMSVAKNPDQYFSEHQYLICDSAYRLTIHMISPYRKFQILSREQEKFNSVLSSKRVAIEHVNGVLKNRFGSLRGLRIRINHRAGHQFACEWITACLILHNMLHMCDPWTDEDAHEDFNEPELNEDDGTEPDDDSAKTKRNILAHFVCSNLF